MRQKGDNMKKNNFCVIGGDFRTIAASNKLINLGNNVKVFGFDDISAFDKKTVFSSNLDEALFGCDYILLPLPYCGTKDKISTPLYSGEIKTNDLVEKIQQNQTLLIGKVDSNFSEVLKKKGIKYFDYLKSEEFSVKNAVPTAEGAVEIALREMPVTLNGSNCLVTGFGRISKLLSDLLKSFGAHITVSARRHSDIAWITAKGYDAVYINELSEHIHKYNVIFNTVPHKILDKELLKKVNKECLIIDLASKPGGVDFEVAQNLGLNVIWALSLPGKVAPLTAGEIITETVLNIIKEAEVR